jgi:hypothetical protein
MTAINNLSKMKMICLLNQIWIQSFSNHFLKGHVHSLVLNKFKTLLLNKHVPQTYLQIKINWFLLMNSFNLFRWNSSWLLSFNVRLVNLLKGRLSCLILLLEIEKIINLIKKMMSIHKIQKGTMLLWELLIAVLLIVMV